MKNNNNNSNKKKKRLSFICKETDKYKRDAVHTRHDHTSGRHGQHVPGYGRESRTTSITRIKDHCNMNNAELYHSSHSQQIRDASEILSEFYGVLDFKIGEKALDIGCGPGYVTSHLLLPIIQPYRGSIVGVDISSKMIDFAKETFEDSNISFQELDILQEITEETKKRLLGDSEGFDKIFSFYCLHWITDLRKVFCNINELLKPGGQVLLMFLGTCPIFSVYQIMSEKPRWKPYMKDVKKFLSPYHKSKNAVDELKQLLNSTGFEVRCCESRSRSYTYTSIKTIKDSIIAVNPFLERLSPEFRDDFIKDCLTESLNFVAGKSIAKTVTYEIFVLHVIKSDATALYEFTNELTSKNASYDNTLFAR